MKVGSHIYSTRALFYLLGALFFGFVYSLRSTVWDAPLNTDSIPPPSEENASAPVESSVFKEPNTHSPSIVIPKINSPIPPQSDRISKPLERSSNIKADVSFENENMRETSSTRLDDASIENDIDSYNDTELTFKPARSKPTGSFSEINNPAQISDSTSDHKSEPNLSPTSGSTPSIPNREFHKGTKEKINQLKSFREDHHDQVLSNFQKIKAPSPTQTVNRFANEHIAYKVDQFYPGVSLNEITKVKFPKNINLSAQGPDYITENVNYKDTVAMENLKSKVISLGHGGSITLKVSDNPIQNIPGADFAIFENVMDLKDGHYWQEIAMVGVSPTDTEDDFRWFPCDPRGSIPDQEGCAGLTPTEMGGDTFDISRVGLNHIKRIRIKDINQNDHPSNFGTGTEGFDFDALRIF